MIRRILRIAILLSAGATALAAGPAVAQETVIIPNRVIYPGETITLDSLDEVPLKRRLKNPGAIVFDWDQVNSKVARRTLLPGRLIPVSSVRDAYLVEPGTPVQVRFVDGVLEIAVTGVPLQTGAAGDVVRVRNLDSGIIVTGVVMADGTIRVSAS